MLLHQRGQDLLFCIVVEPQGNVNKQTGKNAAEERTLSVRSRAALSGVPASPSQALPRQLPQRGSQAVKLVAEVLSVMRKFLAVLLALPLGELSPKVTERAHAVRPIVKH